MPCFYDVLFDNSHTREYERLARGYVEHWSSSEDRGTDYCGPCAACRNLDDSELFHLYYSTLPLTPGVIVDAAVVLMMRRQTEDYAQIHPAMIVYHLFFNCCFIDVATNINNVADFLHKTMGDYNYYDELNFRRISYQLNLPHVECDGSCGNLKRTVSAIAVNNKRHKEVIFVGQRREREEEVSSTAAANSEYADDRLIMASTIVSESSEEEVNIFVKLCGGHCKVCSNMILGRHYAMFDEWDRHYDQVKQELKGANIHTVVKETFRGLGGGRLVGLDASSMIHHKTNYTCRYNARRFVKFFDTFTDMKKISDMVNVKHIMTTFLNARSNLVCSDLYLAIWLERVMWEDKNATNERVSRYIVKTYKTHLF